jgi:hypothetical protein
MAVIPATYNISIFRGGSWKQTFVVQDDQVPAQAVDITGCKLRAQIRTTPGATDPAILDLNTPSEITITDAVNGEFRIFISRSQILTAFPITSKEKEYEWDLFVEWPNGEDVDPWWQGSVLVDPNVTEPSIN